MRFLPLLVRDVAIVALTLSAIAMDRGTAQGTVGAIVLGLIAGALAAVSGFLVHEWGHLIATITSGGIAHPPASLFSVFLFNFDVQRSTRRQFLAMSYGGYAATALGALILASWIDLSRVSGVTGAILSAIGIGVTLVLEVPTTFRVARGGHLPQGGVYAGQAPP